MFLQFLLTLKKNNHTDLFSSWPERLESCPASISIPFDFFDKASIALFSLIFQNDQTEIQGTLKFDRRLSRRNLSFKLGALNSLSFVLVACCNSSLDSAPFNEFSKFLNSPKMLKKTLKSTLEQVNLLNLLWCFACFARTYSHSGNTLCNCQVVWLLTNQHHG